jgi:hypothetical protein
MARNSDRTVSPPSGRPNLRRDTSALGKIKPAEGPSRERVWNTPPDGIAKEENREWGQAVGSIPAAALPDDAATPGARNAVRINSRLGGPDSPGGEGDGRNDREVPLSPANRESDPE